MKRTIFITILAILTIGMTSCEGSKKVSGKVKTVSASKMKRIDRKMTKIYISPAGRGLRNTGSAKLPFCASLGTRRR